MKYQPLIFVGRVKESSDYGRTAMEKQSVDGDIMLTQLGLVGDEQAESKFHGGVDRALCHYPNEHYDYWKNIYPDLAQVFKASSFGENISTQGMIEYNVYIGDIYQWGDAIIQVTQPRSPCAKLNRLTKQENFSLTMQNSGRMGWLYRVIKTGMVSSDAPLTLLQRCGDISVREASAIAFHSGYNKRDTLRLLNSTGLSMSWTATMLKRLQTESIEDFSRRLFD